MMYSDDGGMLMMDGKDDADSESNA